MIKFASIKIDRVFTNVCKMQTTLFFHVSRQVLVAYIAEYNIL